MNEQYAFQDIRVNLCLFNHRLKHLVFDVTAGELSELTPKTYQPEGMTALYDAVGFSIKQVKKQLKALDEEARVKVFFVIITDGYENSSRKFSYEKISHQIEKLERTKKWEFSYLGSTLDAVEIAESLNIKTKNAVYFKQKEVKSSFSTVSDRMASFSDSFAEESDVEDEE